MSDAAKGLLSGRLLARNSFWNLVGMAVPAVFGLFAIPLLIGGMGSERFGLLAIVWIGVGYFSLFDLGTGRALTKLVAERLGTGRADDQHGLIWTALTLLTVMGALGGGLVYLTSEVIVTRLLDVDPGIAREATTAFRILGAGVPAVVVTSALIGLLEAHQRFAVIAAIRVPLGILTFAGPLLTVQFTPSLAWATVALLASRVLALVAYFISASRVYRELRAPTMLRRGHVRPLLSFGGWLTVTNTVGPLMTYLDRVLVGSLLSMTAVAHYVTPYEVLSRVQMLPQSVMAVAFPAMATAHAGDRPRLVEIYSSAARVLILVVLPVTVALFLFAPELLELWVGADFRAASTPVVYWLAAGWTVNTLAKPSFTVLQTSGRPDWVAKTHLLELGPYLLTLWVFTSTFGIAGTAAAWTLRAVVDTLLLSFLAGRAIPELRRQTHRSQVFVGLVLLGFAALWTLQPLTVRFLALLAVSTACAYGMLPVWKRLRRRAGTVSSNDQLPPTT